MPDKDNQSTDNLGTDIVDLAEVAKEEQKPDHAKQYYISKDVKQLLLDCNTNKTNISHNQNEIEKSEKRLEKQIDEIKSNKKFYIGLGVGLVPFIAVNLLPFLKWIQTIIK